MKIEANKHYRMPLIMGPMFELDNRPQWAYPLVEAIAFQYLTEPDAIQAVIPDCYQPARKPMVTVFFSQNNGLEFMAGGGYRMSAFQVAVRFNGEEDHIEGDLVLVMFENKTWPILGGREDLGIPKLFADMPPIRVMPDGRCKAQASLWGHNLYSLEVPAMKSQLAPVRAVASRQINARPWLGFKYIPSLDGPPDAAYPTISYNKTKIRELWLGKTAKVQFGTAGVEDIAHGRNILDALSSLVIVKPLQALHFKGSSTLHYDLSRRLH